MTLQEIQQKYKRWRYKDICQYRDQVIKELYEAGVIGSVAYPYSPFTQSHLIYGLETYSPTLLKYMVQNTIDLFI